MGVLPPQNAHMIDAGQNKGAAGAYSLRWSLEASRPPCRPFPPSWEHVFRGALFFGRSPVIDFKCQAALFSRARSSCLALDFFKRQFDAEPDHHRARDAFDPFLRFRPLHEVADIMMDIIVSQPFLECKYGLSEPPLPFMVGRSFLFRAARAYDIVKIAGNRTNW